jgi:hypothetical protein
LFSFILSLRVEFSFSYLAICTACRLFPCRLSPPSPAFPSRRALLACATLATRAI